jgi:hypothetical protein
VVEYACKHSNYSLQVSNWVSSSFNWATLSPYLFKVSRHAHGSTWGRGTVTVTATDVYVFPGFSSPGKFGRFSSRTV